LKQEAHRRAQAESELSHVLRHTVEMQEAERIRIARELHDTLGQSLTSLQLGLDALIQKQPTGPNTVANLVALREITVEAGREINRLAWEIRPTALDDCGLQTAIRNMLESWSERHSLPVDVHITLDDRRLAPDVETALYRVLQEALTNILRHACAHRAGVFLGITEGHVTMIIDDDGVGMAPAGTSDGKRLGLLGIRERLSLVRGSLEIESFRGIGTTLFVRVPV
jgi:signal transduction histidine kinase